MHRLFVYTLFYTTVLEHVFNSRNFPREDGTDVEQRRAQQRGINTSVRKAQVKTTDNVEEDGYDDVWPPRVSNSTLRYHDLADVRTEVGRVPADVRVLSSQHNTSRVALALNRPFHRAVVRPKRIFQLSRIHNVDSQFLFIMMKLLSDIAIN